jgi:hypothetical protein
MKSQIAPPGQEGWLRDQENFAKQPSLAQTGWWGKLQNSQRQFMEIRPTTPPRTDMEAARKFLMCSAPLLARRGDLRLYVHFCAKPYQRQLFLFDLSGPEHVGAGCGVGAGVGVLVMVGAPAWMAVTVGVEVVLLDGVVVGALPAPPDPLP